MTDAPPLTPRKTPRQSRAQASFDAILTAAARILEGGGMAALNTNLVAERAGVSIGSLYQYFPNKQAIAAELVRRMRAEMRADIAGAVAQAEGRDLRETAQILLSASILHHARAPKLARILEEAEATLPLDDETRRAKSLVHAMLTEVLATHYVHDPETAARDLAAMTAGLVHAAISAGETDTEAMGARAFRAVLGYLDLPTEEPDPSRAPDRD